jgi:hypothetical protein
MAALIAEAVGTGGTPASQNIARPGNRDPLLVVASVTQTLGLPVTGLTDQELQIDPIIVAPGGSVVRISRMIEPHPGAYFVEVVPASVSGTWQFGRYLFGLAVKSGADQGRPFSACSSIDALPASEGPRATGGVFMTPPHAGAGNEPTIQRRYWSACRLPCTESGFHLASQLAGRMRRGGRRLSRALGCTHLTGRRMPVWQ